MKMITPYLCLLRYEADGTLLEGLWSASQQFAKYYGIGKEHFNGYLNVVGSYTKCHFWNNFEIMDLRFFRDEYPLVPLKWNEF